MVLKLTTVDDDINKEVEMFWDLESIDISRNVDHTKQTDNNSVHTYIKDTRALQDGRYGVRIPWKVHVTLGKNTLVAGKRLLQVTKKVLNDPKNIQANNKALREYI